MPSAVRAWCSVAMSGMLARRDSGPAAVERHAAARALGEVVTVPRGDERLRRAPGIGRAVGEPLRSGFEHSAEAHGPAHSMPRGHGRDDLEARRHGRAREGGVHTVARRMRRQREHRGRLVERRTRAGVVAATVRRADDPVALHGREGLGEGLRHPRELAGHDDRPLACGRHPVQEVAHADRERDDIGAGLGRGPAFASPVQQRMHDDRGAHEAVFTMTRRSPSSSVASAGSGVRW